jgi:hypothetical protein
MKCPVMASGDLNKGNCILLPHISWSSLLMALKKEIRFTRYAKLVVQKSNIDHLYQIFRYKTLRSLRSYSTAKGKERVIFCYIGPS